MKTFNKTNFYGTSSLSISDEDNANIFETANHAIHWLNKSGLINPLEHPCFDDGLFIAAYKSHVDADGYSVYKIFNFGAKAAIYVQSYDQRGNCISQKFLTNQEADKQTNEMIGWSQDE